MTSCRGTGQSRAVRQDACATDVLSGEEVLLSRGDAESALMASSAIPVVFSHVELAGIICSTGESAPIPHFCRSGARSHARAGAANRHELCARGTAGDNDHHRLACPEPCRAWANSTRDVARFEAQVRITIVPPLCPLAASVFDFSQAASLIDRAARQTQAWLASGGMESSGRLHVPLLHHDRPKG